MKNLEIRNFKKLDKRVLRFTVAFQTSEFGNIVIKGIRVSESPKYDDIWVQPPSYHVYGKYHPTFFLENKMMWDEICSELKEIYLKYAPNFESEVEVDVDELIEQMDKK